MHMEKTEQTADTAVALSPLADPVVAAIFSDVESAGLAAESLIGAVLAKDGVKIGKVVSVTPQRHYKHPGNRGCRIDIEAATDENERAFFEVQLNTDPTIFRRNLFSASRTIADSAKAGTTHSELAASMPRVISINILDFNIRDDNKDFLQPVKLLYSKAPHIVALEQFSIYNIQLPRFRKEKADFSDPLYCWIYAMDTAMREQITIREVIKMTPQMQQFETWDTGFKQYCDRYDRVAANPATRDEYYRWIDEQIRQQGMILGAEERGREEGRMEEKLEVARNLFAMGFTSEQVSKGVRLPIDVVQKLLQQ
jgi:predicted transposase/invertase (TIGR01784 family)